MSAPVSVTDRARSTLVIAPHPDDESLGCGGLMAALVASGGRVHTVFVTDGGASHRNSPSWPRARLAARREDEAQEALRRLGAGDQPRSFLRLPDAAMPLNGTPERDAALRTLTDIVAALKPDLALLPWRRDPHCDHRDCWSLATEALEAAGATPEILEYAVWLDEIGAPEDRPRTGEAERVMIDVSTTLDLKRAAVAAHVSQMGTLIADDPDAFHLTTETIERLTGPQEAYWRPC